VTSRNKVQPVVRTMLGPYIIQGTTTTCDGSIIPLTHDTDIEEHDDEDFLCVLCFLGAYRVLFSSSCFVWTLYIYLGTYSVSSNLSNLDTIISILRLILM
jgi:hypothetical protein